MQNDDKKDHFSDFINSSDMKEAKATRQKLPEHQPEEIDFPESKKLLKDLTANMIDPVVLTDLSGKITYTSKSIELLGYDQRELVGTYVISLVHPEDCDLVRTKLQEMIESGQQKQAEFRLQAANGDYVWFDVIGKILPSEGWRIPTRCIFCGRDSTKRKQTESLLNITKQTYIDIFNSLTEAIYILDETGTFIEVNHGAELMYGYPYAELVGQSPMSVAAAGMNNMSEIQQQMVVTSQTGIPCRFEFWARRKTGEIFPKDVIVSRGKYFGKDVLIAIARDITEQKLSELTIRESKANLTAILENSLESIWAIDTDYKIQYINEVFATEFHRVFGIRLANGMNILEALPDSIRSMWKGRYNMAFEGKQAVFLDVLDLGSGNIYGEIAMQPILLDGKVVGASFYGKNITDKKQSELQIRYESNLRNLLVELSSDFINLPLLEIDQAINSSLTKIGEFVGADRAYIFDYDFEKNIGNNAFEWCRAGIIPFINELQDIDLSGFEPWIKLHKEGKVVFVSRVYELPQNKLKQILEMQDVKSIMTIPLISVNKSCIGFVGFDSVEDFHNYTSDEQQLLQVYAQMLVNIKLRKQSEEELVKAKEKAEESDRLKSAFLANMSHEIRTPMNGILGFSNLLKEANLKSEEQIEYLDLIEDSGVRMLNIINDIICISKIEAGLARLDIKSTCINDQIEFIYAFFKPEVESKGIKLSFSTTLPDKEATILSDPEKIYAILTNLVKNAIKYSNNGSIEIGYKLIGRYLEFFVSDTGIGIPPNKQKNIFERFVQVENNDCRTYEGAGLGLSIAKAYVQMLGGQIKVESKENKGSTFRFTIPYIVEKDETGNQATDEINIKPELQIRPLKILLAEDDQTSATLMTRICHDFSKEFIRVKTGTAAVEFCRANPDLDLIFMDIKMSDMNGYEATRKIRSFNPAVIIIAQTAYGLQGDREAALEAGCNEYLSKPVNKTAIIKILKNLFESET